MSTKKNEAAPITAYKGFSNEWKCRGFEFKVGETYIHEGKVEACESGWHSCENPLDVWNYYGPCESKFARVEASGELARHGDDSKIASARITVSAELSLPQFIADAIEFLKRACSMEKPEAGANVQAASGYSSQLAASGHYSKLAASGDYSKLAASGDSSIAIASATNCRAMAGDLGCIALTRWVAAEKRYRVSVGYVGENIKAGVWYELDSAGAFVEVQP